MAIQSALKFHLLLCLSILLLSSPHAQARRVKYCDKKQNYAVKVAGVNIMPDPVVRGKPATFKISASTGEAISGGKLIIEVSYFGVHVHTETRDLCDEVSCPVAPGDFEIAHTQTLPSFTPPGSYTLKMTMEDVNEEQLSCISFNFKIGFRSSVSDV
ncbi:putative phosphatidylglycerol/phosphatidylinositol transfer protein DDB_G0282179 [Neltuma alba]|uniref:putative phosphatidylglycerol/phosphatidylinositol transfer protein DDB_G0282179 n=1 Tax=Neltuma alba TaxID=207710 RepID=UPI0010A51F19|nr:putative phosphatidylglycerol/phosphatidylinositol transfer protein DDB_G0282179 [Prosopis alba]